MSPELRDYAATGLLRDGTSVHVRAIRPADRELLASHFAGLSAETVYYRFFRAKKRLTEEELTQLTELDFVRRAALLVTEIRDGEEERIIGVGRYVVSNDDGGPPWRAEVAFTVSDAWQGRGVGSLLLDHLARIARANDIVEFEADVLGGNNRMLRVFQKSGFGVTRALEGGVFHVSFPTEESPSHVQAADLRMRVASAASIEPVLSPRSVAIVGASRDPDSLGATLLGNVVGGGFTGKVFVVNPHATAVAGLPAHPTVSAIGEPVDLAVVAVPTAEVEDVVRDCVRAGVRGVVVITAGFAERSAEGKAAEERLVALARGAGMRLVGPNCMGLLNTDPAVRLNATVAPTPPLAGNVSMLLQSGALGLAVLDHARALGIGFASFVSVGNKADVSGNDLLSYWADDPQTQVILLYLESFGNPRRFARLAPEVAMRKPIVAVKSGRSAAGTRAAQSHSAALANLDVAVDALFEHAGVIRTETLEQLFDVATLLSTQPAPPGNRVGVVTNAGGPGTLLADACAARGLALPDLDPGTIAALRAALPPEASPRNPVDLLAWASPEQYELAIAAVGADPNVDALVVVHVPPRRADPERPAAAIARGAGAVPPAKPVLTVFLSARGAPEVLRSGPRGALPSYSFPENAAAALAAAERWARWRRRPRGTVITLEGLQRDAVRAVVDRVLEQASEPVWMAPEDASTVLRAAGIEVAPAVATRPDGAREAAQVVGFPLVLKALAPGLLHKSDVGGVVLDIESDVAVDAALARLERNLQAAGHRLERVLVQREIRGGLEALVGVTCDQTFGALVLCGLGGVLTEVLRDVGYRLPPVSDLDAEALLAGLRGAQLLDGWRGLPPADRAALVEVIQRVSALVMVVPEIRELDLNPVKVLPPGRGGAVVVDARIRIGPVAPA